MSGDHQEMYEMSLKEPEKFWGQLGATGLRWMTDFDSVMDCDMNKGIHRWFLNGKLNISGIIELVFRTKVSDAKPKVRL